MFECCLGDVRSSLTGKIAGFFSCGENYVKKFIFREDGKLEPIGNSHPHEVFWDIVDNKLFFYDSNKNVTNVYDKCFVDDIGYRVSGRYLFGDYAHDLLFPLVSERSLKRTSFPDMIAKLDVMDELQSSKNLGFFYGNELDRYILSLGFSTPNWTISKVSFETMFNFSGLRMYQNPYQVSELLKFLSSKELDTYIEIGIGEGGFFVLMSEFLRRKGCKHFHAFDIVDIPFLMNEYRFLSNCSYIKANSRFNDYSSYIKGNVIVAIDGDHSYEGASSDLFCVLKSRPRFVMFHDIDHDIEGVKQLWREIKSNKFGFPIENIHEITNMGSIRGYGWGIVEFSWH